MISIKGIDTSLLSIFIIYISQTLKTTPHYIIMNSKGVSGFPEMAQDLQHC